MERRGQDSRTGFGRPSGHSPQPETVIPSRCLRLEQRIDVSNVGRERRDLGEALADKLETDQDEPAVTLDPHVPEQAAEPVRLGHVSLEDDRPAVDQSAVRGGRLLAIGSTGVSGLTDSGVSIPMYRTRWGDPPMSTTIVSPSTTRMTRALTVAPAGDIAAAAMIVEAGVASTARAGVAEAAALIHRTVITTPTIARTTRSTSPIACSHRLERGPTGSVMRASLAANPHPAART